MEQRRTRRPEQRVDDEVFSINSGVRSRVRLTRLSGSLLVHSLLVLLPGSHHCPVTPPACLTPTLNSIKVEQRKRAKQSLQTSYGIKLNLGLNVILFFFFLFMLPACFVFFGTCKKSSFHSSIQCNQQSFNRS